jgi:hypothetical protein
LDSEDYFSPHRRSGRGSKEKRMEGNRREEQKMQSDRKEKVRGGVKKTYVKNRPCTLQSVS